jgi:CDP-glycerol glycerophosphotransferase (TagB/SpsB family)
MRIAFYHFHPFHHAMLDPVQAAVGTRASCLRTEDPDAVAAFAPHAIVLAEHHEDHLTARLPEVPVVWTRHGFSSKNYLAQQLRWCDYACIGSAWSRTDYDARGWRPRRDFWLTGFPALDAMHGAAAAPRASHERCVLYAPTHNALLSSLKRLGRDWGPRLREALPDVRLLIKPHPLSHEREPAWMERFARWSREDAGIEFVADPIADVYALLPRADVLLTDASSVMFYFLALDRPVVLYTSPLRADDPLRFDRDGAEWAWRDLGIEFESPDARIPSLRRALDEPAARAASRARYRERVLGDTFDGRAAARVADKLLALA